jgi:hypothetical protein
MPDALARIRDVFLKLCDSGANIVMGFSWKTDLVGVTSEFPYKNRDAIKDSCWTIPMQTFSEMETNAILDRLADELYTSLRKDLRFFLSEFSQGYPWLLKKLCAHVKEQREKGVQQSEMAQGLLNVELLFKEDIKGLTAEQEDVLRRISRIAPISIQEVSEEFGHEIVQTLVDRRLVVRVSNKYDIYWDIFRDYLNTGKLPPHENYILRMPVSTVYKAVRDLLVSKGVCSTTLFRTETKLSEGSFFNVTRDMNLLGIADITKGNVRLKLPFSKDPDILEQEFRNYLNEKLKRNRNAVVILDLLTERDQIPIEEVARTLMGSCPYISASPDTWRFYAKTFLSWLDAADLILYDKKGSAYKYEPTKDVRERKITVAKRRGSNVPRIQYGPIETVLLRIVHSIVSQTRKVNWEGIKRSTVSKSLAQLEEFGFITRSASSITVLPPAFQFYNSPDDREKLFGDVALKQRTFAVFVDLLQKYHTQGRSLCLLGTELRDSLGFSWTDSTSETNVKIMLDWARRTGLAPGVFKKTMRERARETHEGEQLSLV